MGLKLRAQRCLTCQIGQSSSLQWCKCLKKIFKHFFLEITPLGVKTCEKLEFDIFKAKNPFLIQGRPVF
jgi:hypothetical protein